MATYRCSHDKNHPYLVISKSLIDDVRLSGLGLSIMVHLLSKKDNWQISTSEICKRFNICKDTVYKEINHLIELGYLQKKELREKGKYAGYEYDIFEVSLNSPKKVLSESIEKPLVNTEIKASNEDINDTENSAESGNHSYVGKPKQKINNYQTPQPFFKSLTSFIGNKKSLRCAPILQPSPNRSRSKNPKAQEYEDNYQYLRTLGLNFDDGALRTLAKNPRHKLEITAIETRTAIAKGKLTNPAGFFRKTLSKDLHPHIIYRERNMKLAKVYQETESIPISLKPTHMFCNGKMIGFDTPPKEFEQMLEYACGR